ncbi:putative holin-like toxin [Brevibacillus porteri]
MPVEVRNTLTLMIGFGMLIIACWGWVNLSSLPSTKTNVNKPPSQER